MSAPGFTAKITSTPTDSRHGKRYGTHNQVFCMFDAIVITQNAFSGKHDAEGVWRAEGWVGGGGAGSVAGRTFFFSNWLRIWRKDFNLFELTSVLQSSEKNIITD